MNGIVNDRLEMEVEFSVFANGSAYHTTGILDSRFSAELVLPPVHVSGLGLQFKMLDTLDMLDGTICDIPVYEANIEWNGKRFFVYVHSIGENILVGVGLLFLLNLQTYSAPDSSFALG